MMIHFVLIVGLFLLAVAVVMLARAVTTPGARSDTIEQISAYGFAGKLQSGEAESRLHVRERLNDFSSAIGRWLGQRFTPVGYVDGIRQKFVYAGKGNADAVDRFLAIRVATVADPFGNLMGLIENPHFVYAEGDR